MIDAAIFLAFYLLGFLPGLCLAVILHELGHLLFGRLSGYRFVSFRLLKWLWTRDSAGKLRCTASPSLGGVLGQCLMAPCEDEAQFRFVLYNLGGGLLNLIAALPLLVSLAFIQHASLAVFMYGMGFASLFMGIVNLLPSKKAALPNDGRNIQEAKKSPEAAHGLYLMLRVNAEKSAGKRNIDYPEDAFALSETADLRNYFVAYMVLLRAAQLEDGGRFDESYRVLQTLEPSALPPFYAVQIILALMFHELVYFGDAASAAQARERIEAAEQGKTLRKLMQMKHPVFLPLRAAKAAFLDDNMTLARALLSQAKELGHTMQNPGEECSLGLMVERLEARMEGSREG